MKAAKREVAQERAKNPPEGIDELPPEKEAVQGFWGNRTQFQNPTTGRWAKRDKKTGQIVEVKDEPYEAVPREH